MTQRSDRHRQSIASVAARLMVEDGIDDYLTAKRRAAQQMGLPEHTALPDNAEVETELRLRQGWLGNDAQATRIRLLREKALQMMGRLQAFNPYLTGSVLDGTAGPYAVIDLLLFADSAKEVEIFLLDQGLAYTPVTPRHERIEAVLELDDDEVVFRLIICPPGEERVVQRGRDGRVRERVRPAALQRLLAAAA